MRRCPLFLLFFLITSWVFSQTGNSEELVDMGIKKYDEYKSGRILYEITGDAEGELIYEFDRYGWLESKTRTMSYNLFGMESNESRLEYRDGDFNYIVDLKSKKGNKKQDKTESGLRKYKSAEETTEAIFTTLGGSLTGTREILGKQTNIWTFDNGNTLEIWEWNGMILGGKRKLAQVVYEYTATSLDLDVETDIQLPDGISWEG